MDLVAVIGRDLGLSDKLGLPSDVPAFYSDQPLEGLRLAGVKFLDAYERLLTLDGDSDSYFTCLATLLKYPMRYDRILRRQAIPTADQVGPRALLQFGRLPDQALAGFIFWRKWLSDIENRSGQEIGYLLEAIITHAIGGVSFSASDSPINRGGDPDNGQRQVDCVSGDTAYEIKIRVTEAASGQGRWSQELQFPVDCKLSGYTPVLLVIDPTPSKKLADLTKAFTDNDGAVYLGERAWAHLEPLAGETMGRFLSRYVHEPLARILAAAPKTKALPDITMKMDAATFAATVGGQTFTIERDRETVATLDAPMPDNMADQFPGPSV